MKDSADIFARAVGLRLAGLLVLLVAGPTCLQAQTMDDKVYWMAVADELEFAPGLHERPVVFDGWFWIGGDITRFWIRAEGEWATVGNESEMEAQFLYSRLIAPFWEAQAGIGVETVTGRGTTHTRGALVLGLEGLAPYWFHVGPQVLVSQEGDISFALAASYELLFTQRLVMEPGLGMSAAIQEVPEFGVGSGFNDTSLSARLRYEIMREIAPYVGVVWNRKFGATADLARAANRETNEVFFVTGLRVWY